MHKIEVKADFLITFQCNKFSGVIKGDVHESSC